MAGSLGLGDNFLHLVHLSLGATEGPEPLLREFPCSLVLGVSQQFNDTALIWGKTGDFLNDITDELSATGKMALCPRDSGLGSVGSGFMAFVQAEYDTGAFLRHLDR